MAEGLTDVVSAAVRDELLARPLRMVPTGADLTRLCRATNDALARAQITAVDQIDLNVLVALCLLGPGKPPQSVVDHATMLAQRTRAFDPDLLLDVVTAYGVGWQRELAANGKGWNGYWPRALTRFQLLARQCVSHALAGLVERIGVWFSTDRPSAENLASDLVFLLTDPVSDEIPWPLVVHNQAATPPYEPSDETATKAARNPPPKRREEPSTTTITTTDFELTDLAHGSKVVFTIGAPAIERMRGEVLKGYQRDARGRAVEKFAFTWTAERTSSTWRADPPRIVVSARFDGASIGAPNVTSGVDRAGRPIVIVANAWFESLEHAEALRLEAADELRVQKCTCGHYRCFQSHRLEAWDPNVMPPGFTQMVARVNGGRDAQQHRDATGYWAAVRTAAERPPEARFFPLIAFLYGAITGSFGPLTMNSFEDAMLYGVLSSRGW